MAIWMYLMLIVYGAACVFLIMVILLQSGKGGGLSSLGASNQGLSEAFGATGAEKTLTRLTTYSAIGFIVLALFISLLSAKAFHRSSVIIGDNPAATAPAVPGANTASTAPGNAGIPATQAPTVPGAGIPDAPAEAGAATAPGAPAQ